MNVIPMCVLIFVISSDYAFGKITGRILRRRFMRVGDVVQGFIPSETKEEEKSKVTAEDIGGDSLASGENAKEPDGDSKRSQEYNNIKEKGINSKESDEKSSHAVKKSKRIVGKTKRFGEKSKHHKQSHEKLQWLGGKPKKLKHSDEKLQRLDEIPKQTEVKSQQSDEKNQHLGEKSKQADEKSKSIEKHKQSYEKSQQSVGKHQQLDDKSKQSDEKRKKSDDKCKQSCEKHKQSVEKSKQSGEKHNKLDEKSKQADEKLKESEHKPKGLERILKGPERSSAEGQAEDDALKESSIKEKIQMKSSLSWVKGTVPYHIDKNSYDEIIIRRIREAMKEIEAASCVIFRNISRSSIRYVGVWLNITNPYRERDCVHGTRPGHNGEAILVLGFDCMQKHHITHALLHALGFHDEVTHPLRDQFVRVLWENIQPKYHPLFAIQNQQIPYEMVEYDTMSIMHFHDRAFSSNGAATVRPLISSLLINPSEGLSQLDIMKLRLAFGHECNNRQIDHLLKTCKSSIVHRGTHRSSEDSGSSEESQESDSKKSEESDSNDDDHDDDYDDKGLSVKDAESDGSDENDETDTSSDEEITMNISDRSSPPKQATTTNKPESDESTLLLTTRKFSKPGSLKRRTRRKIKSRRHKKGKRQVKRKQKHRKRSKH